MKNKIILLSAIFIIACGPTKPKTEAVAATQISSAENLSKRIDDHFKEMQKLMEQQNLQHRKLMQEAFKDMDSKNAVTNKTSVKSNEDEENYYYELEFSGVKKEEINVAVMLPIFQYKS